MRVLFGIGFLAAALAIFVWVGIYLSLYLGFVGVIDQLNAEQIDSNVMAWSIVKIVLFETFGSLAALIPLVIGWSLIFHKFLFE